MILLDGHSLKQKRKVPLISMQLTLNERDSSASIVPADMTGIAIGAWLQDDTNPGKGIVWRVKSIRQNYNTDTFTVQLEHIINSLRDRILFGEVTPATITGNKKATKCTAKQALQYILGKQSDWKLGGFIAGDSNPYKFDGDTLYDAIETVTNSLADAEWTANTSEYPFVLHIMPYETRTGSVLRPGRNLKTITKTIDKSGMFTRFYPIGANDLHLSGNGYVEKNAGTYGVISKVETDQSITTEAELRRWAEERLKMHAEPTVSIDIEGVELADATGETLDRLKQGMHCEVPLHEFGTQIRERIVTLNYPDKVKNPENVRITLANTRRDVTKIISDAIKKSGKSGRTSSRKAKQDNAWIEDTNDHVAMCAKGIIGTDAKGNPNWTRLSQIYVDGTGIVQQVTEDLGGLTGRVEINERHVGMVVGTSKDGKDFIKAAEICVEINKKSTTAKIVADKVMLGDGESTLNATLSILGRGKNAVVYITKPLQTKNITLTSGRSIKFDGNGVTITEGKAANLVSNLQITRSGNTYTLKKATLGEAGWTDVGSFSRAVSSWVWGGGDGKINVQALPQQQTKSVKVSIDGQNTITANGSYTYTVDYENADGDDVSTGATKTVTVNVPQTTYTSRTLRCTSVEPTYPGSTTNYYYFRLEGKYSFSANTNYTFYRTSWT